MKKIKTSPYYEVYNFNTDISESDDRYGKDGDFGKDRDDYLKEKLEAWIDSFKPHIVGDPDGYHSIQHAIIAASENDVIKVPPGLHASFNVDEDNLTIQSENPDDPRCVAATIIFGCSWKESDDIKLKLRRPITISPSTVGCELKGLTITGGRPYFIPENTNEAESDGGGIDAYGNMVHIEKCIIRDNHAKINDKNKKGNGGGISNLGSGSTISQCIITNNTAEGYGGGLYNCDATIKNCLITHNFASNGGGLDNCDENIINCTIVGNVAWIDGGNEGAGGGLRNCDGSSSQKYITNCIIWQNSAEASGTDNLTGCSTPTYSYGTTAGDDPQFVNFFDTFELVSASFTDTVGPDFTNDRSTIEVSNAANYEYDENNPENSDYIECKNDGILRRVVGKHESTVDPDTITVTPRLLYAQAEDYVYTIYNWGPSAATASEDYHLKYNSPCFNTGDNSVVTTGEMDIDGDPRILADTVDMGADEFIAPFSWLFYPAQCCGDADGNGVIDMGDYSFLRDSYNKNYWDDLNNGYDPSADFDRDGMVDNDDFIILGDNFRTCPTCDCSSFTWPPVELMKAHWKFDETSDSIAYDSTFLKRDGTLYNFPVDDSKLVTGQIGNALDFDGTDDFVEIIGYKGIVGGQSRTVCAWINTSTPGEIISWGAPELGKKSGFLAPLRLCPKLY